MNIVHIAVRNWIGVMKMIDEKRLIERIKWSLIVIKGQGTDVNYKEVIEKDKLLKIINEQSKVGEWIPCSERLPNHYEQVLVFTDSHTQEVWVLVEDGADEELWEDDYGYGQLIEKAIAWMPLPQPYKGE